MPLSMAAATLKIASVQLLRKPLKLRLLCSAGGVRIDCSGHSAQIHVGVRLPAELQAETSKHAGYRYPA